MNHDPQLICIQNLQDPGPESAFGTIIISIISQKSMKSQKKKKYFLGFYFFSRGSGSALDLHSIVEVPDPDPQKMNAEPRP